MKRINLFFIYLLFLSISAFSQLPPIEPPLPTGVSALQVGFTNSIFISWTPPLSGLTGYKIYLTEGGVTRKLLVEPRATSTYTATGLRLSTSYNVSIRSIRVNSPGDTTESTTGTVPILVPMIELVAPTITVEPQNITPTSIGLRITDSNVSENGFEIEFSGGGTTLKKTAPSGSILFEIFSGLSPKTTYSIRVRAFIGATFGPFSNILIRATLMDFPPAANITSSGNCPTTVNLNWTIPNRTEDVQSLILQLSFDNVSFNTLKELQATDRSFVHTDAIPGRNHFYRIVTLNSTGITPSNTLAVTTKSFVGPNPISNLISDQTNKSRNFLTFRWTNGAEDRECNTNIRDEIVVEIKINNESSFFKQYKRIYPFESSIKIEGLNPKDIVEVAVLSVSNKGLSSPKVFAKDTTAGPPYDPSNLIIVAAVDALNNRFFDLSWKDNSKDEDYFVIEKSIDKVNYFPIGKIKFNITSFKDFDLEEGIIYNYRVKAGSNTEGESKYSSAVFGLLDYSKIPNAPYALRGTVTGTKVTLRWYDDASNEENYSLEKSSDNGVTYATIATLGRNINTFVDENTQTGKKYSYRVKAANPKGSSAFSNIEVISVGGVGLFSGLDFSNVNIYPNPTSDAINIAVPDSQIGNIGNLKVIDKYNRLIFSREIKFENKNDFNLDLKGFPSGLYNVIISNNKETVSKKIYKN